MSERNDGGLAFPHDERAGDGTHWHSHLGMSLRDYFAGQALAGMGTWWPNTPLGQILHEPQDIQRVRAEYAYAQADAMLEARDGKR